MIILPSDSPFKDDGIRDHNWNGLKIEVMGEWSAKMYNPNDEEVCISITNGFPLVAELRPGFKDILRLRFDDTPDDELYEYDLREGLQDDDAEHVAEFVLRHRGVNKIVIHCFAGASRSRSMAAAICAVLKLPYHYTVKNSLVYSKVTSALENLLIEK